MALNPGTSPECLRYVMGDFDLALVMTVNPGFGGQKMIRSSVEKIAEIRAMLDKAGYDAIIEVDGGVNEQTAPMLFSCRLSFPWKGERRVFEASPDWEVP